MPSPADFDRHTFAQTPELARIQRQLDIAESKEAARAKRASKRAAAAEDRARQRVIRDVQRRMAREDRERARMKAAAAKQERQAEAARRRAEAKAQQAAWDAAFTPSQNLVELSFDDTNRLIRVNGLFHQYIPYHLIKDYDVIENGIPVEKGGLGAAVAGGLMFGLVGALAGAVIGGRRGEVYVDRLTLQLTLQDTAVPAVFVDYISSRTKTTGFVYKATVNRIRETAVLLDRIIARNTRPEASHMLVEATVENPSENPYEEIRQLKGLVDAGIITMAEFDAKKRQLLGL